MQNYTASVPAVQKALAVLDHLRQSGLAATLTELSQALTMNRSTLLAVLNTLRSAGFVVRDSEDRYRLGPELLSYGRAAAKATAPVHVFHEPGDWLVDVLGESAGLFALSNTDAVCLAACPARRAIGGLLEVGSRHPAAYTSAGTVLLAGLSGEELLRSVTDGTPPVLVAELAAVRQQGYGVRADETEQGQVGIAAPVCDGAGSVLAAIGVVGPVYRLNADRLAEAARLVVEAAKQASLALGCAAYAPFVAATAAQESWRGSHASGLHGEELDAFLAQPWVASLACLKENGYPYTVPVWYEWRQGAFWLLPRAGAVWASYLRAHPQVSMTIGEPQPPFRRVLVEGLARQITSAAGQLSAVELEHRLARRYLGRQAASYLASPPGRRETVVRIEPDKMTSWEGLVAHPRYREPAA